MAASTRKTQSLDSILGKKTEDENVTAGNDVGTHAVVENPDSDVIEQDETKPVEKNIGNFEVLNKTPGELSSETPAESAKRYNISDVVPDEVHNNPNILRRNDDPNYQIPAGTHLHPDVARDNYNRSLDKRNDGVTVSRQITELVFAAEAEHDDKGRKGFVENDRTGDVREEYDGYAPVNNNDDKFDNKK